MWNLFITWYKGKAPGNNVGYSSLKEEQMEGKNGGKRTDADRWKAPCCAEIEMMGNE